MSDDNKIQVETIGNLRDQYLAVEKKKNQLEKEIFWLNANLKAKKKAEFKKALLHPESTIIDQEAETLQSVLLAESEKLVTNLNEIKKELALKDAKIQILEAKIAALEMMDTEKSKVQAQNTGEVQKRQSLNETSKDAVVTDDTMYRQEAQIRALETKIAALETERAEREKIQLMETSDEERNVAEQNERLAQRLREVGVEKKRLLRQINDLIQEKHVVEAEKGDRAELKRLSSFDLRDDDVRNEPFIKSSFK